MYNVHVVYMTRDTMILMREIPFEGNWKRVGPKNRDFLGPEMATSGASAIWAKKVEIF
jgi:hypothetical protein